MIRTEHKYRYSRTTGYGTRLYMQQWTCVPSFIVSGRPSSRESLFRIPARFAICSAHIQLHRPGTDKPTRLNVSTKNLHPSCSL
jgi:hypothetical protein